MTKWTTKRLKTTTITTLTLAILSLGGGASLIVALLTKTPAPAQALCNPTTHQDTTTGNSCDSKSTDLITKVGESLALTLTGCTLSETNPNATLTTTLKTNGSFSSCKVTASVATNNPNFHLSLQSIDSPTYTAYPSGTETNNIPNPYYDGINDSKTNLVRTYYNSPEPSPEQIDLNNQIPPHTGTIATPTAINNPAASAWGFAIPKNQTYPEGLLTSNFDNTYTEQSDTDSTDQAIIGRYASIPTETTDIKHYEGTPITNNATDVFLAARTKAGQYAGAYKGTILFTATGELIPEPIIPMQTFTITDCQALPIYDRFDPTSQASIGSTITLTDTRNNQDYTIRRLQDGKCWMIDNLKLKLTDGMVLTPDDTNVVNNTTVSLATGNVTDSFTTTGYLTVNNGSSTTSPNLDAWRQVDPSNTAYCLGNTNDTLSGSNITLNSTGSKTGCGYLYNWFTAVAGSATQTSHAAEGNAAQSSICPAGWRLPHAYSGATADSTDTTYTYGDFAILNASMNANSITTTGLTTATTGFYENWYPTGSFRGVPSGFWGAGLGYQGGHGYLWSSSVYSATSAPYLYFYSDLVNPGNNSDNRNRGRALRCVAGS